MTRLMTGTLAALILGATSACTATGDAQTAELEELRSRLARLEAKEEVLNTFNQYLYSMDTGHGDDIFTTFCADAILDVPNFPGAGGDDLHFEGIDAIRPLYKPYNREPRIGGGHHSSNIAVNVHPDLARADLSAYFMTSGAGGVQGGRYEGILRNEGQGRWCWERFIITSGWGFRAKDVTRISEPVPAEKFSPWNGRPALYQPAVRNEAR